MKDFLRDNWAWIVTPIVLVMVLLVVVASRRKLGATGAGFKHQVLMATLPLVAAPTLVLLLPVSVLPFPLGLAGIFYLGTAVALGLVFLWLAIRFWGDANRHARRVFKYSVIYLPLLLLVLALDKT